jgi:hypothetical protein
LSSVEAATALLRSTAGEPEPAAIRKFVADAGLAQVDVGCDAEMLQAQSEFWRIVASRRTAATEASDLAFEDALREAASTQQISCFPTSGLAWADLAALSVSRGGWDEKSLRYLELSQRLAPYEGEALALRLKLMAGGLGEAGGNLRDDYLRDLGTALEFGTPQLAATALKALDGAERAWVEARLRSLPEDRQAAIAQALEALKLEQVN